MLPPFRPPQTHVFPFTRDLREASHAGNLRTNWERALIQHPRDRQSRGKSTSIPTGPGDNPLDQSQKHGARQRYGVLGETIRDEPLIIVEGCRAQILHLLFFFPRQRGTSLAFFSSAPRHLLFFSSATRHLLFFSSQNLDTRHPLPR